MKFRFILLSIINLFDEGYGRFKPKRLKNMPLFVAQSIEDHEHD